MEVPTTDPVAYSVYLLASTAKLTSGYTDSDKGAKPMTRFPDPTLPPRNFAVATSIDFATGRSRWAETALELAENKNTCSRKQNQRLTATDPPEQNCSTLATCLQQALTGYRQHDQSNLPVLAILAKRLGCELLFLLGQASTKIRQTRVD
jgi:hypothetical protein